MYVCLCKGVTDKQIREEMKNKSPAKFKEICNKLGVGKDCGMCSLTANEILQEIQSSKNNKP